MKMDILNRTVRVGGENGQVVELTTLEFFVLKKLMDSRRQIVERETLRREIWRSNEFGTNIVDVYVGRIRKKIGERAIESVRGKGYRFRG